MKEWLGHKKTFLAVCCDIVLAPLGFLRVLFSSKFGQNQNPYVLKIDYLLKQRQLGATNVRFYLMEPIDGAKQETLPYSYSGHFE